MKITKFLVFALAISVSFTGCSRALMFNNGLYSHTIEPLTFNREPTELNGNTPIFGRVNQFQYPLTSAASIRLGKNGFGEVAKENGFNTIYYADLERRSFLFGLWSSEVVHIYGR